MFRASSAARTGALIGALLGGLLLLVIAIGMLRSDAATYKVLAAVVLWALPFPGFGAAVGWLAGSVVQLMIGRPNPAAKDGDR